MKVLGRNRSGDIQNLLLCMHGIAYHSRTDILLLSSTAMSYLRLLQMHSHFQNHHNHHNHHPRIPFSLVLVAYPSLTSIFGCRQARVLGSKYLNINCREIFVPSTWFGHCRLLFLLLFACRSDWFFVIDIEQ